MFAPAATHESAHAVVTFERTGRVEGLPRARTNPEVQANRTNSKMFPASLCELSSYIQASHRMGGTTTNRIDQ